MTLKIKNIQVGDQGGSGRAANDIFPE